MQSNLRRLLFKAGIIIFTLPGSGQLRAQRSNPYATIAAIPVPQGYHRIPAGAASFAAWLRNIPLKKDRTVYLFDGRLKRNQDAQFAVLDISVGKQDLQQCADAVMRLRSEYLYSLHSYSSIEFYTEQGARLNFGQWQQVKGSDPGSFRNYLTTVFTYCSTRTLEKQLVPVTNYRTISGGDVLIRGGSPGHAMLVADIAEDAAGRRIYLLSQSYMPAQDIHIVNNPGNAAISPWFDSNAPDIYIETPEWTFRTNELRCWPTPAGKR
ncbi:MAG TPA: DUF4846 domain-containing protein [Puia sp.]|nr:DUF4846 domain-containing protein [Puia sp.]